MKVPMAKPLFDESEEKLLLETLRSGWIVQGNRVARFEELFSERVGCRFSVATSNCTSALHLSLAALGIGPGDEVIVPSFTYVATANAVEHTGARAVFCDIDLDTYNMNPASLQERISPRTRAVIPVHLFGLAADLDPILNICRENELRIVEDAACGLGATYNGEHVGTFGNTGCFSFHPRKVLTTAEGGMITLKDEGLYSLLKSMRDHGASASDFSRHIGQDSVLLPDFNVLGYNYRLTDLQAAIGIAQMEKLNMILRSRREIAGRYRERLEGVPGIVVPDTPEGAVHSYQSYVLRYTGGLDGEPDKGALKDLRRRRDELIFHLQSRGVAARQGAHAVHTLGYYSEKYRVPAETLMNSLLCECTTIALPQYPQMTDEEQDYVVGALLEALD